MPAEPLTAREWWLVRQTYEAALQTVQASAARLGLPGTVVVRAMLHNHAESGAELLAATEKLLEKWGPDD